MFCSNFVAWLNAAVGIVILTVFSLPYRKLCSLCPRNRYSFEKSMEDDRNPDGLESEEIPDLFLCCVCLELLYKPIVLACGHICCFWCIHKSMKAYDKSHCPLCRLSYYHFPTICQMLHLLLLKMYPIAYQEREQEILQNEKQMECFSPQFPMYSSPASCTNHLTNQSTFYTEKEKPRLDLDQSKPSLNKICGQLSVSDVMCPACKELLFSPVVLNCGHVFCETCLVLSADGLLRCLVCQIPDPRGIPRVCLMLKNILEEHFPNQYALNRDASVREGSRNAGEDGEGSSSLPKVKGFPERVEDQATNVHYNVGCDSCGLFPIIGERYKCIDCVESIGFDLCGDCYKSDLKLPGRFNQHHSAEHRFKRIVGGEGSVLGFRVVDPPHVFGDLDSGLRSFHIFSRQVMANLLQLRPREDVDHDLHVLDENDEVDGGDAAMH